MMTEKNRAGEFVLSEGNGRISRDVAIIAAGAALGAGTVLGQITANSKLAAYDPAATDGTETAVAILYADVDAESADAEGVIIARSAEVKASMLVGSDADAVADLALKDIIVRT